MRNTISKPVIAALAALSLTASVFAAEPASAANWHGGGGVAAAGTAAAGTAAAAWRRLAWRGLARRLGRPGYRRRTSRRRAARGALCYGYGYGYPYGGYGGCYSYQPMYDAYGNYIGQQAVRTCYSASRRAPDSGALPYRSIRASPPIYGRNASGIATEPSGSW